MILGRLDAFVERVKAAYEDDPAALRPALLSFCRQGESITTASAMQTALHCFGKYSGAAVALSAKRKKSLVGLKRIGVQPTALARRKMAVGGRRRTHLGRPAKSDRSLEHGYCSQRKETGLSRQVWPKRSAPHSMASVVSNLEPLGRTHSNK